MKKLFVGTVLVLLLMPAAYATAMPKYEPYCMFSGCGGISEDGTRAIFTFDEPLDDGPGPENQVFQRFGGETTAIVPFPEGKQRGVKLHAVSDDARRAIVQTRSPLAAEDTDGFGDDYFVLEDGGARLLSWDPADPATAASAKYNLQFQRASDDARTVYFIKHVGGLSSFCWETWARSETAMTKLPIDCRGPRLSGVSRDGSSVFYTEDESISTNGWNWAQSIFRIRAGEKKLINGFPKKYGASCSPLSEYGDSSADGETLLFTANHPVSPLDTDLTNDVYIKHAGGSYELVSDSPPAPGDQGCGWQDREADKALGLSSDGTKALFTTQYPLADADTDDATDAYVYTSGGAAELVTTGPTDDQSDTRNPALGDKVAGWHVMAWRIDASDDLETIAFDTTQRMTAEDTDDSVDVYVRRDGVTSLVSTGPAGANEEINAKLLSISNDGTRIAFTTVERLLDVDMDDRMDIYARTLAGIDRAAPARATVSAGRAGSRMKKRRARTVLISAESVAPKVKLRGSLKMTGKRTAALRLSCPKKEETGPCRGKVTLKPVRKGAPGKGSFSIKAGKSRLVKIKLKRKPAAGTWKAKAKLVAADRLGNRFRTSRKLTVRP
ncbi:MAG: hypothetical protein M3Y23_04040 [Actinomycetota bacterium]|nr:hypothetical protein [Actinomycetota bacterium]